MILKRYNVTFSLVPVIAAVLFCVGCSVPPPKSTIERVIVTHFESGPYKVTDMVIGDISPIPAKDKQYMGTAGYVVNLPAITLEFTRDIGEPWNYKRGHHLTFHDGTVRIKKGVSKNDQWIVVDIAGIPAL